jgi:hypothetical protein
MYLVFFSHLSIAMSTLISLEDHYTCVMFRASIRCATHNACVIKPDRRDVPHGVVQVVLNIKTQETMQVQNISAQV